MFTSKFKTKWRPQREHHKTNKVTPVSSPFLSKLRGHWKGFTTKCQHPKSLTLYSINNCFDASTTDGF